MEQTQNPIKTQISNLYLQLSEVTAKMENQIMGGVAGDYRLTYFEFRELMYQFHKLSNRHIKPYRQYDKWRSMCHRNDKLFSLASIRMFERYSNKLIDAEIINIGEDVRQWQ